MIDQKKVEELVQELGINTEPCTVTEMYEVFQKLISTTFVSYPEGTKEYMDRVSELSFYAGARSMMALFSLAAKLPDGTGPKAMEYYSQELQTFFDGVKDQLIKKGTL
jgi:hypothetical protein